MKAQRVQIAQALLRLAPEVTAKDRTECVKKLKISKVTVCYYLSGKVTNNDKALLVLEYLKSRVELRQKEIQSICK